MGISKDLSQTPYFDDYNEDKNFHRVLFKPATAVQARELNQLQTMLQDQVERFGENILIEGTIVEGGNFTEINPLPYVKILDNDTNNRPVVLSNYVGLKLLGKTSGVTAQVVTYKEGFQSQDNKNTLYVKYTSAKSTVGDDQSQFDTTEQIQVLNADGTEVTTLIVAGTRDPYPIGNAYGVTCGEGIVFQKGHFIRFYDQIEIVSRYNTTPTDTVIGFEISESIVDSFQDTSLLDNAAGFNNEQAPGADRLKLTPTLVVLTKAEALTSDNFFVIQEYQNGNIVRRNVRTRFNSIGEEMSRRTLEESGNYAISPFVINIDANSANNDLVSVGVGSSVGYVQGNRVEILSEIKVDVEKPQDSFGVSGQNITTNYGNYYTINNLTGTFPVDTLGKVYLWDSSGTPAVVGTARVRTLINDRIYIFDVSGSNVASATKIGVNTANTADNVYANADATADITGGIFASTAKKAFWDFGKQNIESVSTTPAPPDYATYVVLDVTIPFGSGAGDLNRGSWTWRDTSTIDETFVNVTDYQVIRNDGTHVPSGNWDISSGSASAATRTLTVDGGYHDGGSDEVFNVVVPVKRSVQPSTKELETVFVRIDGSTHNDLASGQYSLGLPDVYEIVDIWKATSNNTFTEAEAASDVNIVSVKSQYTLRANQKDSYYDYSYIQKKSGSSFTNTNNLLVKAKVFKKSASSTQGYFVVNSYPVDDTTTVLPADKIRTQNIPTYKAENGKTYSLRDIVDFRPYPSGVTYNTTEATADTINDSIETLRAAIVFGSTDLFFPITGEQFEVDYNYYVGRIDKVYIDEKGLVKVKQGIANELPGSPSDPSTGMVIAELFLPPYPCLPSVEANRSGHPEYGITFKKPNNRRYTMKDIAQLDNRIKKLEYYTVLNALEKNAEDYAIKDANGLDRYKNGIFVDNFKNLLNGDTRNPGFSASIDKTLQELAPRINQYYLDMEVDSVTNATKHKDVTTLNYESKVYINQPYATKTKSCTTDYYRFTGTMRMYPEYDAGPDTTIAPDIQMPDLGLVETFTAYTDALMELAPFQSVTSQQVTNIRNISLGQSADGTQNLFQTETTANITTSNIQVTEITEVQGDEVVIGDFITDVSFKPYIRQQDVEIEIFGMMPNKIVHFYFDEVNVDEHIATAKLLDEDDLTDNETNSNPARLERTSEFDVNNEIRADADGVVRAIFRIPEETFWVGDRKLEVSSAGTYSEIPEAVTYAIRTFRAFNFNSSKSSLTTAPRQPIFNFSTSETTETGVVTTGAVWGQAVRRGRSGGCDPIAQTFYIDRDSTSDSVVQVLSLDVYFSSKPESSGNGVTAQIYETINGYPSSNMVSYAYARLDVDDVVVSDGTGTSLSPTTFTFDNPVTLGINKEYCIVVQPDGNDPDYRLWIAKTGETDVISGNPVTQNVSSGVLFTSTNKRTWTPYQDENMTFKINKAEYTATSGTVTLKNSDHEFFDIENFTGTRFQRGEKVFKLQTDVSRVFSSDSITVTSGTKLISAATVSKFNGITGGDTVVVDYGSSATPRYQAFTVSSINNDQDEITPKEMPYGTTTDGTVYKTVVGTLDSFYESPIDLSTRIILKSSNADGPSTDDKDKFVNTDVIIGTDTQAQATITTVIDLPVSYFNMNLYKSDFDRTRTSFNFYKTSSSTLSFDAGSSVYLNKDSYSIKSKSNMGSSDIPFKVTANLQNIAATDETKDSSPVFDHGATNLFTVEYRINNSSTNETTVQGDADSRYMSKQITLADQMDASDLSVILTGYKPVGADIKIYARLQAGSDLRGFDTVEWTELEKVSTTNVVSSSVNRYDWREIEYRIPQGTPTDGGGALRVDSDSMEYVVGSDTYTSYKYFAIKIVLLSENHYSIPRVKDMRAIALA